MSNPSSPAKSSIGLTCQQGGSLGVSSGSSSGTSGSSSGASGSNAQQSSIAQANETSGNAPAAVAGAKAMVDLNRSIRTPKPYYSKKDGDFKTWVRHLEHYVLWCVTLNSVECVWRKENDCAALLYGGRSLQYRFSFKYHGRYKLQWCERGANAIILPSWDSRRTAY